MSMSFPLLVAVHLWFFSHSNGGNSTIHCVGLLVLGLTSKTLRSRVTAFSNMYFKNLWFCFGDAELVSEVRGPVAFDMSVAHTWLSLACLLSLFYLAHTTPNCCAF